MEKCNIEVLNNDITILKGLVKIIKECIIPILDKRKIRIFIGECELDDTINIIYSTLQFYSKNDKNDYDLEKEYVYHQRRPFIDKFIEMICWIWSETIFSLDEDQRYKILYQLIEGRRILLRYYDDKISKNMEYFLTFNLMVGYDWRRLEPIVSSKSIGFMRKEDKDKLDAVCKN